MIRESRFVAARHASPLQVRRLGPEGGTVVRIRGTDRPQDTLRKIRKIRKNGEIRNGPAMATDLFSGTAWYYARYRVPYPSELFAHLAEAFGLDGSGPLLDLGCGTGQVTIPLSRYFEETIGLDPSDEMLVEARHQAERGGADKFRWLQLAAEEISLALGRFAQRLIFDYILARLRDPA